MIFTNFKLDLDYQALIDTKKMRYIAYGLETCPTTKKEHHQGWMTFHAAKSSIKNTAALLGDCHVEMMKGSLKQNDVYCSKQTSGKLVEFGDKPMQGKRVDLEKIRDEIMGGTSVDDITKDRPMVFHCYGRVMDRLERIALREKFRTEMTRGMWYYGPTGTGKSHTAFINYSPKTCYVKCLNDEWWDGYCGQPTVILNDFRGQIKYEEMLQFWATLGQF